MRSLYSSLRAQAHKEEGQTVVEWCIMVGLVALAVLAGSPSITQAVLDFFTRVSTSLTSVGA